jgi:hypothetical protein
VLDFGITVIDDLPDFTPGRQSDNLLIPTLATLGFRGQELQQINQCRKFLRVTWIGELTMADGTHIERHAMEPPFQL